MSEEGVISTLRQLYIYICVCVNAPQERIDIVAVTKFIGLCADIPFFRAFSENMKCLSSVFLGKSRLTMRRGIAQLGSFSMLSSTAASGVSKEMNPTRGRTSCSQRIQLSPKS